MFKLGTNAGLIVHLLIKITKRPFLDQLLANLAKNKELRAHNQVISAIIVKFRTSEYAL